MTEWAPSPPSAAVRGPHPAGTTVLVLGILGVVFPVVSFVAWFMGSRALREVAASPDRFDNPETVRIGRMLGKVVGILTLVSAVLFAAVVAFYVMPARG